MENLSGTKVPILTKEDLESLEEMCGTTSGYFYKMLDYLDECSCTVKYHKKIMSN